jgi:hypothetical protein
VRKKDGDYFVLPFNAFDAQSFLRQTEDMEDYAHQMVPKGSLWAAL